MFFNYGSVHNEPDVTAVIMTWLSINSFLDKWFKKLRGSIHSDMNQIHMRDTFIPLHRKYLTKQQSNTILKFHIFLKENRDGTLKFRILEGGNKERDFISNEYASSPIVATKSFLLAYILDIEK